MKHYGVVWRPMKPYEALWSPMEPYGALWSPMGPYGPLWSPTKLYPLWSPSESYEGRAPWNPMQPYAVPWSSMKPYGGPMPWTKALVLSCLPCPALCGCGIVLRKGVCPLIWELCSLRCSRVVFEVFFEVFKLVCPLCVCLFFKQCSVHQIVSRLIWQGPKHTSNLASKLASKHTSKLAWPGHFNKHFDGTLQKALRRDTSKSI